MKPSVFNKPEKNSIPELANLAQLLFHVLCLTAGLVFIYFFVKSSTFFLHVSNLFSASRESEIFGIGEYFWFALKLFTNFAWLLFVIVFTGSRLRALGNIVHECSHNIFFRSVHANQTLGILLSLLLFQSFQKYRDDHRSHHKFLGLIGSIHSDQDLARYKSLFQEKGTQNSLRSQLALALKPRNLKVAYQPTLWNKKDSLFINFSRTTYAVTIFCSITFLLCYSLSLEHGLPRFAHCAGLFAALLPFTIVYPALCVWSDIADHCINFRSNKLPEDLSKSRNHIFKINVFNFLFFPRNDAYHLVHHLFPSTPISFYPAIHNNLLVSNTEYAKLDHTLRI